jgi:hypothetical protein
MRKAKRLATKLESMVQSLSLTKVSGNVDEKPYARRKLSDGVSSRYLPAQRLGRCDATDSVLGGRKAI